VKGKTIYNGANQKMPKQHNLILGSKIEQAVSIKATGFKAGLSRTKGWFKKVFVGLVPQRSRDGALARVERVSERASHGDRYHEKVTMKDTGEVIHECNEPLSEHRGHGSAA
jgi:hypothetical protein